MTACAPSNRIRRPVRLASSSSLPNRGGIREDLGRDLQQIGDDLPRIDLGSTKPSQKRIVVRQQAGDLVAQRSGIAQIADPDRAAADLVFVSRADTAPGRADLHMRRADGFARTVELCMKRQDQCGVLGQLQIGGRDRHALGPDALNLTDKMPGIDDDAAADDRDLVLVAPRLRAAGSACRYWRR